jgi:hypothetical protein
MDAQFGSVALGLSLNHRNPLLLFRENDGKSWDLGVAYFQTKPMEF